MAINKKQGKLGDFPGRGLALAEIIKDHCSRLGLSQKKAAAALSLSEPYYTLLISGKRWFGSLDEEKLKRIAEFLDLPLLSIYMLAEIIHPEDFFRSSSFEAQLDLVFESMIKDPRFMTIMPTRENWSSSDLRMKLLCVVLYQDVSTKDFLEKFNLVALSETKPKV